MNSELLLFYQVTTAHEVVMLALREFGSTEPSRFISFTKLIQWLN